MNFFKRAFTYFVDPLRMVRDFIDWVIPDVEMPDFGDQQEGFLFNKQSNDAQIPIIYGERLIGGTRVFVSTAGTDNVDLYIALVLCEGEIDSINDIYIDDVLFVDTDTSGKYYGLVTIDEKLGADIQAASSVLTPATGWDSACQLNGIAYLGIKIIFNADAFKGIPTITAVVKGKKVYDPRKDSTSSVYDSGLGVSSQREATTSTWEYSNNPAICLRDYLTNTRYGKGIPAAEINIQGIADGANFCDETVTEYTSGPTGQKTYTCNAIISTDQSAFSNTQLLLRGMRGMLPFSDGEYKLVIDDDPSSTNAFIFTRDNIVSEIEVISSGRKDRYNRCIAKFANPVTNWQTDQVSYPEKNSATYATYKAQDNGLEQDLQLDLPTITSQYQARDIARVAVLASRQQTLGLSFTADPSAIKVEVGDLVKVYVPDISMTDGNNGGKLFKCKEMSINPDSTCSFNLFEHDATSYPWAQLPFIGPPSEPNFVDPASVPLPDPVGKAPGVGSNTDSDGVVRRWISYQPDATAYPYVDYYELEYREVYNSVGTTVTGPWIAQQNTTRALRVPTIRAGTQYQFRHRYVSIFGTKSAYSSNGSYTATDARDGVSGVAIADQTTPVNKLEPATSFDFLGTAEDPEYKFFLGPSGSGTGFENSDYAMGGKAYQAGKGGVISYSELGPGLVSISESKAWDSYFYAGMFFGGYNYAAAKSPTRAELGSFKEAGRFRVGNIITANVSNATSANPSVITTATAHNLSSDDVIYVSGFTGTWAQINDASSAVTVLSSTTFSATNLLLANLATYSSNGGVITRLRPAYVEDGVSADVSLARANGVSGYTVYTSVGTVGPFTASHDGMMLHEQDPEMGDILIDVEVIAAPTVNDAITSVSISAQANQAGVIGVFAGDLGAGFIPASLGEDAPFHAVNQIHTGGERKLKDEYVPLLQTYKFVKINSIGEGKINVCGQGGDLAIGDLIVASDTQGKGMKQNDDIIRSYTVAKSRENVTFASAEEVKQIACIYLGG